MNLKKQRRPYEHCIVENCVAGAELATIWRGTTRKDCILSCFHSHATFQTTPVTQLLLSQRFLAGALERERFSKKQVALAAVAFALAKPMKEDIFLRTERDHLPNVFIKDRLTHLRFTKPELDSYEEHAFFKLTLWRVKQNSLWNIIWSKKLQKFTAYKN